MPEAFSGNVAQFKVIDILKLLASEGKSGGLHLQKGKEKGEIYVDKGALYHAICKDGVGEEAIFAILTWTEGNFNFTPNTVSDERTIDKDTPSLLKEAMKQLDEWQHILEIIPSQDLVFKLSSKRAPDEVRLKHDSWSVLSQIDGKKTVRDISDELKITEHDTARILYQLFSSGLIEVAVEPQRKEKKIANEGFFSFVEEKLTEIIGPVASVILDEEIIDMGEEKGSFPVDKVSILVERLSKDITDDTQRIAFQKMALDALKGY
jgi:DNA-binding MarR family transcriptional regulator